MGAFEQVAAPDDVTEMRALQITSKLHRQQLVRAMKRVILGLGAVPGMPQDLQCTQVWVSLDALCSCNCR